MAVRIQDVARHAGVSSATVSRVLANKPHVRQALREQVLEAVDHLGYEPNRVARSLRVQRSSIIGLVISDIQNSFFNTIVRAIEDVAHQNNYAVFLCNSDENPAKEKLYLNLLKAERVAGVILTPTRETASTCQSLIDAGIPVVTIDRSISGTNVDSVKTNNSEAAKCLVDKLIERGHQRIAAILPDLNITTGRERFEGYQQALNQAGLKLDTELIRSGRPITEDGYALTCDLLCLPQPPTALFSGTKLMTLGAVRAILETNRQIPRDLELAAFDKLDWMPCLPSMSYAEQPTYQLGTAATKLLLERLQKPAKSVQHAILKSDLYFSPDTSEGLKL